MSVELDHLTNRQWATIRAALKFWKFAADNSRHHPSRHPDVSDEFATHGPLSLPEIDEILSGLPPLRWVTIEDIAKMKGVSITTVQRRLQKLGIEPDLIAGRRYVYRVEKIEPVVHKIGRLPGRSKDKDA